MNDDYFRNLKRKLFYISFNITGGNCRTGLPVWHVFIIATLVIATFVIEAFVIITFVVATFVVATLLIVT